MKKTFSLVLAIVLILTPFLITGPIQTVNAADSGIKVKISGELQNFSQAPVVVNGITLVPMREIFEALDTTVTWNASEKSITAKKEDTVVYLRIGEAFATVNGKKITLQEPARIINGYTLVPLRFVSEALGAEVKWDGATKTIDIFLKDLPQELKQAISDNPTLDPHLASQRDSINLNTNIYEGLFRIGPDQEFQNALAESYTVSKDQLTWTFKIRDAKWHDGSPITAYDFEYGIMRASDENYDNSFLINDYVVGVSAKDSKTLEMKLKKPTPYFKSLLVMPSYFPVKKEFVEKKVTFSQQASILFYPMDLLRWLSGSIMNI